ncbi:hypothetical protein NDA18_004300 [Ustilago nuda]|nr:hypothetical protein NDA18_004300 [Ustilago nuda]
MADLSEIGTNNIGITILAGICSKHDPEADSMEISDKVIGMTIHMQAEVKLEPEEDQAPPGQKPSLAKRGTKLSSTQSVTTQGHTG